MGRRAGKVDSPSAVKRVILIGRQATRDAIRLVGIRFDLFCSPGPPSAYPIKRIEGIEVAMAICPEFSVYEKEAGRTEDVFVQKFLIPLLSRLGFSIVVNYHGRQEFGRDIIFGEIDRFGDVRYHGLQAKFEGSIGLGAISSEGGVVDDCKQAFTTEFIHPHTGAAARISSFYAVNAGSFSDEARHYFFTALRPIYADNVRLIDGRGLLALDRLAAITLSEDRREVLAGLLCEVEYNFAVLTQILPGLKTIVIGDGHNVRYPPNRLRLNALSSYLVRPILGASISLDVLQRFWLMGTTVNSLLDGPTASPLQTVISIKIPAEEILSIENLLFSDLRTLKADVTSAMSTLGPFVAI